MNGAKVISACGVFAAIAATAAAAQVSGVVVDSAGRPVSSVEVVAFDGVNEELVFTDAHGRFEVELEPELALSARKQGFGATELVVPAGTEEVLLQLPLSPYTDQLVVEAGRDTLGVPPTASLATVSPTESTGATISVTDLVAQLPAVSENGQGGLLQVFSVRGLSRHRVLTLFDGLRIVSDRRAGTSTSFVDPQLVEGIEVVRGPASSRFGSGALGGVVNLIPVTHTRLDAELGWRSGADAAWGKVGWGGAGTTLAVAHRRSGDGETPEGASLFSRYRHSSILAATEWSSDDWSWRLRGLGSIGCDIGKVSTDFPERTTLYQEDHWVGRLVGSNEHHTLAAGVHPGTLETEVRSSNGVSTVVNRAADWSLLWNRQAEAAGGRLLTGVDVFARSGVEAEETEASEVTVTLDGRQLETSAFATWERRGERSTLAVGGRWTVLDQGQREVAGKSESAGSAFVGWTRDLPMGWDVRLHAGSGWRFASLSERYFRGTTGRGQVIGNPELEPERSWSGESGLRWTGTRAYVEATAHFTLVDDYIERIDIGDVRTFVNLDSGSIVGLELAGSWSAGPDWTLDWGGHMLDGEADSGLPLADIPPSGVWLGASWRRDAWSLRGRLEQRLSKNDVASGESPLGAATLASLRLEYGGRSGTFALTLDNLLDETYRSAADDKLPAAEGRSIGLSWRWAADS